MVYADDSKSSLARGGGSSPLPSTNNKTLSGPTTKFFM